MTITERVDSFLNKNSLSPYQIDMGELLENFMKEMENGLSGSDSSLPMIPTYITVKDDIPKNEPVIVMDAGGTNFRVCLVTFSDEGTPSIEHFSKFPMPGSKSELSKDEFFNKIVEYVLPIAPLSSKIGFCFSYPAIIMPNKDGKLIHFSKEIKAPEVIGEMVGAGILANLEKKLPGKKWQLCMLNDTVATLLAGKARAKKPYDDYIGFILGTGTNTCYVEAERNIIKTEDLGNQIINIESGSYDILLGDIDKEFYDSTKNPDSYHFEKLISGAYIGPYFSMVIKHAVKEGLFSECTGKQLLSILPLNTIELDSFMHTPKVSTKPGDCCELDDDKEILHLIVDRLTERTAKLTAVNIAATVLKTQSGKDPEKPVCINADGTTFHKTYNLKKYTKDYLDSFLTKENGRYWEMVQIDDAPILGAAIAGLQQD